MSSHHSYKVGFAVSFLIMITQPILYTPLYVAAEMLDGLCHMNYQGLSSLSQKLYEQSYDEDTKFYSDVWNEILIMLPNTLIGCFVPVFLVGLFYHKATNALNDSLSRLSAKKDQSNPAKISESNENETKSTKGMLKRQKENKAVAKLMMCISVLTCAIYVPTVLFDWVVMFSPRFTFTHIATVTKATTVLQYMLIFHAFASPLFYAGLHREVRKLVRRLFSRS